MSSSSQDCGFPKEERLCSQRLIDELFAHGGRLLVFPYSVRYCIYPAGKLPRPAQVLVVAPKRKLHYAVDRNRVKRISREAYRRAKSPLVGKLQELGFSMTIALSYVHDKPLPYDKVCIKMAKVIEQLSILLVPSN
ncbi:MAG: ribonuclease P protein component [Bacteroidales bacterium]|nr:ribonuclease P protein component [Candidatus Colimorpha onthohippi]